MTTLSLTLTLEQAYAMSRQLDLANRIHLCQFREIEQIARMDDLKHRSGRVLNSCELAKLDLLLTSISHVFGFESNASFGIGSQHVSSDAHRGYEIKKVVDRVLAMHHEPNPTGCRGVNYDGLIVRYTNDPAPVAVILGDNNGGGK